MGLLGCPASFQGSKDQVLRGLQNLLIYIDDVLIHTHTHKKHLEALEQVLMRLHQHHLKINLDKCLFGDKQVSYLGFTLTPEGIKPGKAKLKAIKNAGPPSDTKEIRSFKGLCNFFRHHIQDFAITAAPLFKLTRQDSGYLSGPLPTTALEAFKTLQNQLSKQPALAFPRTDQNYLLITGAYIPEAYVQPWPRETRMAKFKSSPMHPGSSRRMREITRSSSSRRPLLLGAWTTSMNISTAQDLYCTEILSPKQH